MAPTLKPQFHAMTTDEIAAITEQLGDAVVRAEAAGSTPSRFTAPTAISSPGSCRASGTGATTSTAVRSRTGPGSSCEVVTEAKSRTGGDFPVWVRLDALEYRTPDGITFDECEITARLAVEAGADAIHLSAYGDMTSGQAFTDGMILDQEAKHSALSGRLTEALRSR